jgi:hypothetical protein
MKKYIKIDGTENEYLKVHVYYALGGMNYWNGKVDPRGYYLSVQRVERKSEGAYFTESFMVGSGGVRTLLLETKRKSDKAMTQAVETAKAKEVEMCDAILSGQY